MAGLSANALTKLLKQGIYSDFTITCQGVEFKVHKAIICPESDFFTTLCNSEFKESHEAQVDLPEIVLQSPNESSTSCTPIPMPRWKLGKHLTKPEISLEAQMLAAVPPSSTSTTPPVTNPLDSGITDDTDEVVSDLREARLHARMYFCADRLGISSLQAAASTNAIDSLSIRALTSSDLPSFLSLVFENTHGNDSIFRTRLLTYCILLHDWVKVNTGGVEVIVKHEPTAWDAGINVMKAKEKEIQRLKRL